jgi:serine/threonine protein kinase
MRTNVIMEGYLAPEIIAHCDYERANRHPYLINEVALPTFTKKSDLFCLAVHIFKSLMNGVSPFLGIKDNATGSKATPFIGHEGVERNNYVFKQGLHPSAVYCLAPNEIPRKIISMFSKAFIDGHINPNKRPTAEEWYKVLVDYMGMLASCPNNPKHQYYNKLNYCPYCEADKRHLAVQTGINISQPPTPPFKPIQPPKKKWWKSLVIWQSLVFLVAPTILIVITLIIINIGKFDSDEYGASVPVATVPVKRTDLDQIEFDTKPKADYGEGERLDANGNGLPDFIVKNGRLIGTVSGNDFGPATFINFNNRKITRR